MESAAPVVATVPVHRVESVAEADRLPDADLSDWFNPFLRLFVRETFRGGGEVWAADGGATLDGLFLFSPAERCGSIFTRSVSVAEAFYRMHEHVAVYSEHPLGTPAETFDIFSGDIHRRASLPRFRHAVRAAMERDLPEVASLLREVLGAVDERWFAPPLEDGERCFLVEVDGRLAGCAWASLANGTGRLHSLAVRPRFRGLGIGTDLALARLTWLGAAGASHAISEIAVRNAPCQAIAERAGMRRVGRLFEYHRT